MSIVFQKITYRIGQLETLNLSGNNLETLPESIGDLQSLKKLDLRKNRFEKIDPFELDIDSSPKLYYLKKLIKPKFFARLAGLPSAFRNSPGTCRN